VCLSVRGSVGQWSVVVGGLSGQWDSPEWVRAQCTKSQRDSARFRLPLSLAIPHIVKFIIFEKVN